jgi:hypothetical protein
VIFFVLFESPSARCLFLFGKYYFHICLGCTPVVRQKRLGGFGELLPILVV